MLIVSVSVIAIISTVLHGVYMHVYMCGVKYLGRHQIGVFVSVSAKLAELSGALFKAI